MGIQLTTQSQGGHFAVKRFGYHEHITLKMALGQQNHTSNN
jgi:hypothetical protein